ncbi:MAG: glycerate kinase, partial [Candidatus Bipolaricaulia bacterium]
MRVLIAPAPFKGSLSSIAAADAIARGLRAGWPDAELSTTPLADGGEGTLHVLHSARDGTLERVTVTDPFGRAIEAQLGWLPGAIAVVEMAQAAGLALMTDEERDPMRASTHGVGESIRKALDGGAREIWIGLGGSATVDGGLGMLQALGAQLLDDAGRPVSGGGQGLRDLASVDLSTLDARLSRTPLKALCDVDSPLLGPQGAQLYMLQKGATTEQCEELASGLARFADLVERDLAGDVRDVAGAGAAGGLGAALTLLGADLVSGSRFVMDALDLDRKLASCDLVI